MESYIRQDAVSISIDLFPDEGDGYTRYTVSKKADINSLEILPALISKPGPTAGLLPKEIYKDIRITMMALELAPQLDALIKTVEDFQKHYNLSTGHDKIYVGGEL